MGTTPAHFGLISKAAYTGETHNDRQKLIEFVEAHNDKVKDWRFSPLTVYPGTPFWNRSDEYQIDLSNVNQLYPFKLAKSYWHGTSWQQLLLSLSKLHQKSMEGRLDNSRLFQLIEPSVRLDLH